MSMNLGKQTFSTQPDYLIAGPAEITTAVKEASADIVRGNVIKLAGGKAAAIATKEDTGIYGIAAEDAKKGEKAIIYLSGEFFADGLVLADGIAAADVEIALRNLGIFLK